MKTPSNELFLLIKSLSSQEKVQFKIYASRRKEDSNYIRIFDTIDRQQVYDEVQLKKIFKREPFVKYLYRIKPYIHESVLKCLQEYYASDSVEAVLCNYTQQIELLINKQLYVSASKLIEKAEKVAIENHHFPHLMNILLFKQRIMVFTSNAEGLKNYREEWYLNVLDCIKKYQNIIEYRKINIPVIIHIITQLENLTEEAIAELHSISKNALLKNEKNALSYPAKSMHHVIRGNLGLLLKDYQKSYTHFKKAVSYFDPARLAPDERLHIYNKLTVSLRGLQKGEELRVVKNEAENLILSLPKKLQTNGLYRYYLSIVNNYISYHLAENNLQEALSAGDRIQALIEKHASVQVFMVYYTNRFIIYFAMADYRQALNCSNKVLALEKTGVRGDVISFMKILNIMIHYELGNEDILPGLCKSVHSSSGKKRTLNEAEKLLLDFFSKKITKARNEREKQNMFLELKKGLIRHKTEKIVQIFDFIPWAESKIQNRPMIEVLKEKS